MTLLMTLLLIEAALLAAAALLFLPPTHPRSGLETEWDDPVPEPYRQAWSERHGVPAVPLG